MFKIIYSLIIITYQIEKMSSLNDFLVLGKIGEGAYSIVHKVKRISDGNVYALKKVKITAMKQKQKENSLNEVRILASISNDYIIGYKEAFFDSKSNTLCIIMEYAEGGDLEKTIQKKKRSLSWVPETQIWKMIREVLSGLALLHQMNIIHRDIKCANIFISDGKYKLGDMNVSKLLKQNLAYTQTGTPYYASPEVWNDKPYQLKSDIWSLGCVIYEYCALKPPFTATSMEGLYKKVMKGIYPRIPGTYSEVLQKFIKQCLQLDAKNRSSCKELFKLLPPSDKEAENSSSVNLLSTIRMPRNLQSWREQLPKSNYTTQATTNNKQTVKSRFGHLSQQKLKQIVRLKNPEGSYQNKKSSIKRITPDMHCHDKIGNYHDSSINDRQRLIEMIQEKQKKQKKKESSNSKEQIKDIVLKKNDILPKIKIHSEPSDNSSISYKLREQERNRKYNYNRPAWWG